jgi:DNA-binding MarR family transcriptional regulator
VSARFEIAQTRQNYLTSQSLTSKVSVVVTIQNEIRQTRPFASPAEEAAVALMRTSDLVRRVIASVLERHDITNQQYNVLRILRGAGDAGLPTLEIAERMLEQTPGITRLIDRLERKRLVTRERCATDRRQVFCRITAEGLALAGALDAPVIAAGESAMRGLSDRQMTQLLELLELTRTQLHATLEARRESMSEETSTP